ncbi:HDOD domain-containing protein [Thalassotalea euphylliae]|uniref:HDOD domain-containing protein n=1 Tax=Thalassotalea euphylliae TaxID=1655234 RepID=UPI00362F1F36
MFKTLVKAVFPSLATRAATPNYEVFAQSKGLEKNEKTEALTQLSESLSNNQQIQLRQCKNDEEQFLAYLFGETFIEASQDELASYLSEKITLVLKQPSLVLNEMPVMPSSVALIIDEINNEEFNTDALIELINTEPSIATNVVSVANSAKYKRAKEITDIKSAFMAMGAEGLVQEVLESFLKSFKPANNIYFKQFGEKIWQHCLQTAVLSKQIAKNLDPTLASTAYLAGLLSNVGTMIVFQLTTEAFSVVSPDASPGSATFQRLIIDHAKKVSFAIGKHWELPPEINKTLALQERIISKAHLQEAQRKLPLAAIVFQASKLSQLLCLFEHQKLDDNSLAQYSREYFIDNWCMEKIQQSIKNVTSD